MTFMRPSCPAYRGCERVRVLSGAPSRLWVFPDSRSQRRARMYLHANAKLGLAGRVALVGAIEGGMTLKAAAAAFSVSPATAHRWWHRWLDGGRRPEALLDRSSRPRRSPRLLALDF